MKKAAFLTILLILALLTFCALPSARADENLTLNSNDNIRSMCWQGDTLYLLGEAIYRWQPGDADPQIIWQAEGIDSMRYWETPPEDDEQLALWRKAIRFIFPGTDAPLALHPYSGEVYSVSQEGLALVATIPEEGRTYEMDGETMFRSILGATGRDGVIWMLLDTDDWNEWDKRTILRYDTVDGSVVTFDVRNIQRIEADDNGMLLAAGYVDGDAAYLLMDGATGDISRQYEHEVSYDGEAVPYGEGILEYAGGKLVARDAAGSSTVKGYAPAGGNLYGYLACSDSGLCAVESSGYVFIRDLNHPAEKTVLTIAGSLFPDNTTLFSMENPDIAVVVLNESAEQAAMTGSADLFAVVTPGGYQSAGVYKALVQRRGLAPIQSETLNAQAASFYESVRDAIAPEGTLLAWPINAETQTWSLNQTVWEEIGLGDVPTTYTELMEVLDRWQANYADDNPDYALGEFPSSLASFLQAMMREYILQCGAEYPDFTRDDFRQAALSLIAHKDAIEQEAENYGMPLIFSYSLGFGVVGVDDWTTCMMLKPAISSGGEQQMAATLYLLAISSSSKHQEAATRFIEWYAAHLDIEQQYMLDPSQDTPQRFSDHDARLIDLNAQKDAILTALAKADGEAAIDLQDQLDRMERRIAREEDRWMFSAEGIANYRDVASHLVVPYNSPLLTNEGGMAALDERIETACGQGLTEATLDRLLTELNNVARMIMMENE